MPTLARRGAGSREPTDRGISCFGQQRIRVDAEPLIFSLLVIGKHTRRNAAQCGDLLCVSDECSLPRVFHRECPSTYNAKTMMQNLYKLIVGKGLQSDCAFMSRALFSFVIANE